MTGARTRTLAALRGSIERIETHDATAPDRAALRADPLARNDGIASDPD